MDPVAVAPVEPVAALPAGDYILDTRRVKENGMDEEQAARREVELGTDLIAAAWWVLEFLAVVGQKAAAARVPRCGISARAAVLHRQYCSTSHARRCIGPPLARIPVLTIAMLPPELLWLSALDAQWMRMELLWLSALDVQWMRMETSAAPSVWVVAKSAPFLHHY
jgi:hypothetical protein